MQLCPAAALADHNDVDELAQWAQNAFDYLVGNASFALMLSLSALLLLLLLPLLLLPLLLLPLLLLLLLPLLLLLLLPLLLLLLLTICTRATSCLVPAALLRSVRTAQGHVPIKTVGRPPQKCICITSQDTAVGILPLGYTPGQCVTYTTVWIEVLQALLFAIGDGRFPLPLRLHAEWAWGAAFVSHDHSMPAPQPGGLDRASPLGGAATSCRNLL